ncbi:hypothetical protein BRARA_G02454 [Brassica rapa]|uniref:Uncharacterized protein n=1 Tax=Brassica campestris TaxID=3711 RepID=A0A397YP22_BRACM|nr:hypothetical protein BRARA_G02454 [Brassica rapa]
MMVSVWYDSLLRRSTFLGHRLEFPLLWSLVCFFFLETFEFCCIVGFYCGFWFAFFFLIDVWVMLYCGSIPDWDC